MGSVREIAKRVGVSPATVSRAINNHPAVAAGVRERVLAAMNRTRYVPKVGRRSTMNIALAYTGESSLGAPFDAALMQGMSERMEEFGFDLIILDACRAKLPHENFSQMFVRKGIRGAVIRTTARTRNVAEEMAQEGFPIIVVGDRTELPGVQFIYSDSRGSSQEAVEHLIGLGHKRIAVSINVVDDSDHADRVAGYRDALADAGIEFDPRLVLRTPAWRGGGEQLMRRLWAMPDRPTAVYVADPMAAVGAINESLVMGLRVPGDISIIGFDDADLRFLVHPRMTAVCQNAPEIGREAFEVLHEVIKDPAQPPVRRALATHFEVHSSTGEPAR